MGSSYRKMNRSYRIHTENSYRNA